MTPQTGAPTCVYLPSTANLLRERGIHIERLEAELATKNEWLQQAGQQHAALVDQHREQTVELEVRNVWAAALDAKLTAAGERIEQLQRENAAVAAGYAAKVADLEKENLEKTHWAEEIERRLTAEIAAAREELARCLELLHEAEKTVEERTNWALDLDRKREQLEARLAMMEASRWVRLGRTFGVGPSPRNS
jgi:hypothetical protein